MTLFQRPNITIIVAVVLSLLAMVFPATSIFHALAIAAWIGWAYDELKYGANWIRRSLGIVVLIIMIINIVRLT